MQKTRIIFNRLSQWMWFLLTINDVNNDLSLINHSPFNNEDLAWYSVIREASKLIYNAKYDKAMA